MTINSKYKILEKEKLIIRYFQGEIDFSELYSHAFASTKDKKFDPNFYGLFDIRDVEFIINTNSIHDFVEKVLNNQKFKVKRKIAFITDKPNQVVFSQLVKEFSSTSLYNLQIFSSLKPCLNFLDIDLKSYEIIEQSINSLKID